MKILLLLILGIYLSRLDATFDTFDEFTCVDCFDRKFQHGSTYWEGCNFCKCDRDLPLEERCKPISCYFSPCPKLRAQMMKQTDTPHARNTDKDWFKWAFGRK